jgi:hypothetical protein
MVKELVNEPMEAIPSKTTFVYDARTGKVVHIHQFVGESCSDDDMERTALELAPGQLDRKHLSVIHDASIGKELSPDRHYRVDVKARRVVAETVERKFPNRRSVDDR